MLWLADLLKAEDKLAVAITDLAKPKPETAKSPPILTPRAHSKLYNSIQYNLTKKCMILSSFTVPKLESATLCFILDTVYQINPITIVLILGKTFRLKTRFHDETNYQTYPYERSYLKSQQLYLINLTIFYEFKTNFDI